MNWKIFGPALFASTLLFASWVAFVELGTNIMKVFAPFLAMLLTAMVCSLFWFGMKHGGRRRRSALQRIEEAEERANATRLRRISG